MRNTHKLADKLVTFERCEPDFDITDGQLLRALQTGRAVEPGTRVRIAHYEDARTWFEVVRIVEIEQTNVRPIVPCDLAADLPPAA